MAPVDSKYAVLDYIISDRQSPDRINDGMRTNIDEVLAVCTRLRDARDTIRQNYDGRVTCVAHMDGAPNCASATLQELQEGVLEEALREYLSIAGLPDYVSGGSDWDACNTVLAEHGKVLRRRLIGFMDKQVEDIE